MDCMEGMKKITDNSIDLVLTDIPYDGVNESRGKVIGGKVVKGIREIHKGNADLITFELSAFLEELWRVTKGTIIIFCGIGQVSEIYDYYIKRKECTVRQLIWKKTNPSPMNGQFIYLSGIENAIWIKKKRSSFNAFCKNTVFEYPIGSSEMHPTEKNHDLLAELINDNSNVGDVIMDPCSGSGSTLIMAYEMGRKYIGFELDETYYKKARARLDSVTAQMNIFDFIG